MTEDEQFDKWLIEKASDKVDYDLIHSAWLASRHETVEEVEDIVMETVDSMSWGWDGDGGVASRIIAAIRARYQKGDTNG